MSNHIENLINELTTMTKATRIEYLYNCCIDEEIEEVKKRVDKQFIEEDYEYLKYTSFQY